MPLPWIAFVVLWLGWAVSWRLAAGWATAPSASAPVDRGNYRWLTVIGAALIFLPRIIPLEGARTALALYTPGDAFTWLCVALVAAGFAFCWWARVHLGALWSAAVTRKDDHRIIDTGPYGLVRHPIYTGIILAALATALAEGTLIAFIGAALFAASFYIKARLEENLLRNELGAAAYSSYSARVPMLVPFSPFG